MRLRGKWRLGPRPGKYLIFSLMGFDTKTCIQLHVAWRTVIKVWARKRERTCVSVCVIERHIATQTNNSLDALEKDTFAYFHICFQYYVDCVLSRVKGDIGYRKRIHLPVYPIYSMQL